MEVPPDKRPPPWADRARWGLPFVCGARAVVSLASLRVGGVALAGLGLIACYGLIESRRWGRWLAGLVAVASGLWDALFLMASLVSGADRAGGSSDVVNSGLGLALGAGVLALLLLADAPRKATDRS